MSRPFDPYQHWLGIPPQEQPPDHYRLLGVSRFESDARVIQAAAEKRMALIRQYQTGPRAAHTQRLLNELAAAKVRLLNPATKQLYDAALAEEPSLSPGTFSADLLPPSVEHAAALPVTVPTPAVATSPPHPVAAASPLLEVRVRTEPRGRGFDPLMLGWWIPLGAVICALTISLAVWLVNRTDLLHPDSRPSVSSAQSDRQRTAAEAETANSLVLIMQEGNGDVNFPANVAMLFGKVQLQATEQDNFIEGWSSDEDAAQWTMKVVKLPSQGMFLTHVTYEAGSAAAGARYEIDAGGPSRPHEVRAGQGTVTDQFYLAVPKSGENQLTFRLAGKRSDAVFVLKSIRLVFPQALK